MALFFHSDDVDELIPFKETVLIAEKVLKDLRSPKGTNGAPQAAAIHRDRGDETTGEARAA
jgi:hypothetical protein